MPPESRGEGAFVRRVLIVASIVVLLLLAWSLVDVLLLIFGAVLIAVLLRALADPIVRRTPFSDGWALATVTLALVVAIGLAAWLFGAEVRAQVGELVERLPEAWRSFEERLAATDLGERLISRAQDAAPDAGSVVSGLADVVTSFVGGLADLLLIVFGGLYLAAQPGLYRRGVLRLFPSGRSRERIAGTLDASGEALRRWLLGQLVAMAFLFVLTGLGLWAIGVPAALALALLAGLAQFVPLIGPIVAAIPALLIALSGRMADRALDASSLRRDPAGREQRHHTLGAAPGGIAPAGRDPLRRGRLRPVVRAARRPVRHATSGHRLGRRDEALGARDAR
jgi:predicted PurR-regulated permease PerM